MKNNQHENKAFNPNNENKEQKEDQRGGNHNPAGANQYTSGRVDDRGRKEQPQGEAEAQDRQEDQNENN
jgi:hypothetical protein